MKTMGDAGDKPLRPFVPALLSFVAGYIDSYTFLALFGLFAAQVTGSFVIAAAEIVTLDRGVTGKLLAVAAFVFAAALTAGLVAVARDRGRAPLPWMLGFETLLLAVFTAIMLAGAPIANADDPRGVIAGLFAAMAMGAQSALVRLLMQGIPQTNVMTGNMTQLGVESTELFLAWRRLAREPDNRENANKFAAVRARLLMVLSIATGFLVGAAAGAIAYATAGVRGTPVAIVIVGTLTIWALRRDRRIRSAQPT